MTIRQRIEGCPLSVNEIECVSWLAEGKSAAETAIIIGSTQYTVQRRLKSAMDYAMVCKNTALVAKALRMGWIR